MALLYFLVQFSALVKILQLYDFDNNFLNILRSCTLSSSTPRVINY